jgi:hypothetical protein
MIPWGEERALERLWRCVVLIGRLRVVFRYHTLIRPSLFVLQLPRTCDTLPEAAYQNFRAIIQYFCLCVQD